MSAIPFIDLGAQRRRLGSRIDEAVLAVINHGRYIMGPEVGQLESALAEFSGAKHTLTCSSGTDALLVPLMAWGVGPGDAVFVPTFTFAATAEVASLVGATPVFVDVMRDTFNMNVESLKSAIGVAAAEGLNPAVVIPVGLFGLPPDFDAILPVAREAGLKVLDDAAQSFGARYKGSRVGRLGDATATSFFPAKPLGCYGDGGAVFTDDDNLADVMRSVRIHGQGADKYDNARIGLNARLDTIQAAILLQKLDIFEDELQKRQAVADRYSASLGDAVSTPEPPDELTSAWAQYTIVAEDRDSVQARLQAIGVPSVVYYSRPLHQQTAYRGCPVAGGGTPNADWLSQHVLSLPMHPYLDEEISTQITTAIVGGKVEQR